MGQYYEQSGHASSSWEREFCSKKRSRLEDHKGVTLVLLFQVLAHLLRASADGCYYEAKNCCLFGPASLHTAGVTAASLWLGFTTFSENFLWYKRFRGHILAICHAAFSVKSAMEVHGQPDSVCTNAILCCTIPPLVSALGHSNMWPELVTRLSSQVSAFAIVLFFLDDNVAIATSLPMLTATSMAAGLLSSCLQGDSWNMEINPLQYTSERPLPTFAYNSEGSIVTANPKCKVVHDWVEHDLDEEFLSKPSSMAKGRASPDVFTPDMFKHSSSNSSCLSASFPRTSEAMSRSTESSPADNNRFGEQGGTRGVDGNSLALVVSKEKSSCIHCTTAAEPTENPISAVNSSLLVPPFESEHPVDQSAEFINRSLEGEVSNMDSLSDEVICTIRLACETISVIEEISVARLSAEQAALAALRVAELERNMMEVKVLEAKQSIKKAMIAVKQEEKVSEVTNLLQMNRAVAAELVEIATLSKALQEEASRRWFEQCARAMKKVSLLEEGREEVRNGRLGECWDRGAAQNCPPDATVNNTCLCDTRSVSIEGNENVAVLPEQMVKISESVANVEGLQSHGIGDRDRYEGLSCSVNNEGGIHDDKEDGSHVKRKSLLFSSKPFRNKKWLPASPGRRRWRDVRSTMSICRNRVTVPTAKICFVLARQRAVEAAIAFERFCSAASLPDGLYLQADVEVEEAGYAAALRSWRAAQAEASALQSLRDATCDGAIASAVLRCRQARLHLTALGVVASRREPWLALERRRGQKGLLFAPIEGAYGIVFQQDVLSLPMGRNGRRVDLDEQRTSWLAKHVAVADLLEVCVDGIEPPLGVTQKIALKAIGRDMDRVEARVKLQFDELCDGMRGWVRGGRCDLVPDEPTGVLISTMDQRVEALLLDAADRHYQLFEFCRSVLVPAQMKALMLLLSDHTSKLGQAAHFWKMSAEFMKVQGERGSHAV